jgi:hypothetical protein
MTSGLYTLVDLDILWIYLLILIWKSVEAWVDNEIESYASSWVCDLLKFWLGTCGDLEREEH